MPVLSIFAMAEAVPELLLTLSAIDIIQATGIKMNETRKNTTNKITMKQLY